MIKLRVMKGNDKCPNILLTLNNSAHAHSLNPLELMEYATARKMKLL